MPVSESNALPQTRQSGARRQSAAHVRPLCPGCADIVLPIAPAATSPDQKSELGQYEPRSFPTATAACSTAIRRAICGRSGTLRNNGFSGLDHTCLLPLFPCESSGLASGSNNIHACRGDHPILIRRDHPGRGAAWTRNQCTADYSALKRSTQVRTTAVAGRLTLRPYVHIRDAAFHTNL